MSKRIMLHFPLTDFYPLAILFEDAVILGAENDTVLYNASNLTTTCLPYSTLQRTVKALHYRPKSSCVSTKTMLVVVDLHY